jgi:zinc protease
MKRAFALLAAVAALAAAQTAADSGTTRQAPAATQPRTTSGQGTSRTPRTPAPKKPGTGPEAPSTGRLAGRPRAAAPVPAVKDLKFPPLGPIQVPNVETFTLPNGMKVFLLEDHELPVVNGTARVRTGNLFDPPDKIGLATITGMVMRTGGTGTKTGEQLDEELENAAAGAESNIGETSGSVSFTAMKENAPEVMQIFKDVLTAPEFRQDKIDLARTQLRSSISRRNDEPQEILEREFAENIYGKDNSYGWRMEYATLDRITRADIQAFHRRYFFPANVLLAVWGDFDTAQMKVALEKLFTGWTASQPPVPPFPAVSARPAPGVYLAVKTQDLTQTFFSMGELGGQFRDKDYPALEIMANILGGGFQSRLFQRVRTDMGNAYEIGASWAANYDHPGMFQISGSTKSFSTVDTIKAIQEEVERIRTSEVSDDELKTAKDTALNSLVFAFDTNAKTLGRMLTYEYYGYPKNFIQQYQKALEAVTRADVLRAAKERLRPSQFTIVAVANPRDLGKPIESLGLPVHQIDLTIPAPKRETAAADPAGLEKGKRILARAQQAAGGVERLAAVKDYTRSAELQVSAPGAGSVRVHEIESWIAPAYLRQENRMPAGSITAYFDGQGGWIATPGGSGPLGGPQLEQVRGDLFRQYFRLLLSDRIEGRTVNAIGDDAVEISDGDGQSAQAAFDPETGLMRTLRYQTVTMKGPPVSVENSFSGFREVNGVKVPFQCVISQGGNKFADVTVTDFKVNSGLSPAELEKRP